MTTHSFSLSLFSLHVFEKQYLFHFGENKTVFGSQNLLLIKVQAKNKLL